MSQSDTCPRCHLQAETFMHTFRDCEVVKELWESLINQADWSSFFSLGMDQWLRKFLQFFDHSVAGVSWNFIFPVGLWWIWKDRNSLVFQKKTELPGNLLFHIISFARRIIESIASPHPIAHRVFRNEDQIGWTKPPDHFYKLNVDGSVMGSCLQASCGWLIRDHNGQFIKGFYSKIGVCSTIKAELWGLLHGIQLASSLNLRNLIINMDSKLAVQLVTGACKESHHCFDIVRRIKGLLDRNPSYLLSHTFRESNKSVDHLASLGQQMQNGFIMLHSAPVSLHSFSVEDCRGVSFPHLVPSGYSLFLFGPLAPSLIKKKKYDFEGHDL
ncbi:Ribonuclease H domain [Sesbania bispinosa]|nr:Ribonuclease H domain [Sesbania bispinosa]